MVATYNDGFMVIFEPFDERNPAIPDPRLELCCVAEATLVALADGTSVPIECVQVGADVLSYAAPADGQTEGLVVRQVDAVMDRGQKECVELLFEDGRTLVCTPDHRIRTCDGGWVQAGELVVGGDEVAVDKVTYGVHSNARVLPLLRVRLVGRRSVGVRHVYDLSVPSPQGEDTASFVAGGVVVHNCLDASLAMKPVFERFHSVVITSGTLSPLDVYPKVLNFHPAVQESFSMSLSRNVIQPLIVTKGSDQVPISSKFDLRSDVSVIQNYGRLLVDLCSVVPDGVVGFFTSYRYMEDIVAAWKEMGVIEQLLALKLIFIETKDIVETTLALDSYKRACSCGRGALFLSVARGKVAEGIDFDRHFGRCVVIFGIPFQYTLSRVLRCRLEYLRTHFQLSESDFLTFDALRQTAQCVGRVIRSKTDYGLMIFADARFNRVDKRSKLPKWITQFMVRHST